MVCAYDMDNLLGLGLGWVDWGEVFIDLGVELAGAERHRIG